MSIPLHPEDFTVDWLNQALNTSGKIKGARVTHCEARDSDIPGQTAEIILIDVKYDSDDPDLPTAMVAKVTSRNPMIIEQLIANYDQYRRETSFYREFPEIGIPVPECLYEAHDPAAQEMVLLMRDLAPSASPSWAVTPEQVEVALSHLPEFHAKWWNHPVLLEKDWIVQYDNKQFYDAFSSAAHGAASTLDSLYEDPSLTKEIMEITATKIDKVMDYVASRPFTFVHGDYHAKQMFFQTEAGGGFAVIDWQFPLVAQGAWDFARMVGMCLPTEDRRSLQEALIEKYHQGLLQHGVAGYSREALEDDFRMGLVISQAIMCVASADTDPLILEKECSELGLDWREVMFDRTQHALDDWQALDLLKTL